jgi:hypothetical protein
MLTDRALYAMINLGKTSRHRILRGLDSRVLAPAALACRHPNFQIRE